MRITNSVIEKFTTAKVFKDNSKPINALDFSADGELLVTSADDESLNVYNTNTGKKHKVIYSKKYGIDLVRFTNAKETVISASKNNWDESIRYLSLHDNKYLRYFKGHRDRVVSLAMSPKDDTFISASLDNTIRLWDLNTPSCQGLLRRQGRPCVSYDPQGLIFAVGLSTNIVKLYDLRSYDKGPFSTFVVQHSPVEWTGMKFSSDGKYILLSTTSSQIILLDSFSGDLKQSYKGITASPNQPLEASFSPDGQFVLSGSNDGTVHVWETLSGKQVAVWKQGTNPVGVVQWNPVTMMVASADTNLFFWLPAED